MELDIEEQIQKMLNLYQTGWVSKNPEISERLKDWIREYHQTEQDRIDEEEEEDRYILQNFRESLACCIDALVYWENMQQFSNLKTEQEQEELLNLYQKMQERLNLLEERLPDLTPVLVENIRKKKELIDQNVQKNVQLYGLLLQKITENKQKVQSQTKPKTPDL